MGANSFSDGYAYARQIFLERYFLMRKIALAAVALAGSMALIGVTAVPAFAADTPVTVAVAKGEISISAPKDGATLTKSGPDTNLDATATATIAATTVTDLRAGEALWKATVSLSNLSDGIAMSPKTISTTDATYLANTAETVGTVTMATPATVTGLNATTAPTSQAATAVTGNNSASWTATLTVKVPSEALVADYKGVVTQSVS